jgi:replicative DNA helicase
MGTERSAGDPEEIGAAKAFITRLESLSQYAGPSRVVAWQDYLKDRIDSKASSIRFETLYPEIDALLEGMETGELCVVSGLTANGKTLFAKTLTRNMSQNNIPMLILSYEVATAKFLEPFEKEGLVDAKIFVPHEMVSGNLRWVEDRIIESIAKHDNKIVIIDHLHYVVDMNTEKMSQTIGACMRTLKEYAVKYQQLIIILAHQEKLKDDKEPALETLRDSSFIGQESDIVIIVHRVPDSAEAKGSERTYDQGYAVVKIEKARRSGVFKKRVHFQKRGAWLENL